MRSEMRYVGISLALALGLTACSGPEQAQLPSSSTPNPHAQQLPAQSLPQTAEPALHLRKSHPVRFEIHFPRDYQIQATVNASYVRVKIHGFQNAQAVEILPKNGDNNGFVEIPAGTAITVSTDVPEGNNWVIAADYYTTNNPDSTAIRHAEASFHVTAAGAPTVELNPKTELGAMIVKALQAKQSNLLNTAIDLNQLLAFTDALTGATGTDENITFPRLNAPLTSPRQLSARALAVKLDQGLALSANSGQGLDPNALRQTPYLVNEYQQVGGGLIAPDNNSQPQPTFGVGTQHAPVYSPETDHIYLLNSQLAGNETYLGSSLDSVSTSLSQNYRASTSLPTALAGYISLGYAQGRTPVAYANANVGFARHLKTYNLADGSLRWSNIFTGATGSSETYGSANFFTPVSQLNTKGTPETTDDEDVVYSFLKASTANKTGMYAIQNNVNQWFLETPLLTHTAAISANGNALYTLTYSTDNTAKLSALNTRQNGVFIDVGCGCGSVTPSPAWTTNLNRATLFSMSPALGREGALYIGTNQGDVGYLEAYNPDGTKKWELALPRDATALRPRSHIRQTPLVDLQDGKDVVYVVTDDGKAYAINENGTPKWKDGNDLPKGVQLGSKLGSPEANRYGVYAAGTPVLGEEAESGNRILYMGITNRITKTEIAAVRDDGNHGTEIWSAHPKANFNLSGLMLKDGYLYVPTVDGGEGQVITIKRLKVESLNPPAAAPWPMSGGNNRHSGRRRSDLP